MCSLLIVDVCLQSVAQMVYDLVTPVPVEGHSGAVQSHQRKAPHQPQDFREGVSNAYDVVTAVRTAQIYTCTGVSLKYTI